MTNFYSYSAALREGRGDITALLHQYDRGEREEGFLADLWSALERSRHSRRFEVMEAAIQPAALEALKEEREASSPLPRIVAAYIWQSDARAARFSRQPSASKRRLGEYIGEIAGKLEGPKWDSGLFHVLKKNFEALPGADIEVLPAKGPDSKYLPPWRPAFWRCRLRITPHYPYQSGDPLYREDEATGWGEVVGPLKAEIALSTSSDFSLTFVVAALKTSTTSRLMSGLQRPLREVSVTWPTRESFQRLIPEVAQHLIAFAEEFEQTAFELGVRVRILHEEEIRAAGHAQGAPRGPAFFAADVEEQLWRAGFTLGQGAPLPGQFSQNLEVNVGLGMAQFGADGTDGEWLVRMPQGDLLPLDSVDDVETAADDLWQMYRAQGTQ